MRYKNRTRYGKLPHPVRKSAIQYWRDELANNPEANAVRVKFLPRLKGQLASDDGPRWGTYEMGVVRVRTCKGKRT